jgi:hypothetical protein
MVVGTSFGDLQSKCDALETDFRKRDLSLEINIGGTSWTYTRGQQILNTRAQLVKSGNAETDRGLSRAYSCSIEGELPADDKAGLRDCEVMVDFAPGRQKTVTMKGTYTALSGTDAVQQYRDEFDGEASRLLDFIDGNATFEMVKEEYNVDRNRNVAGTGVTPHLCSFSRQYVQLLKNQSAGNLDDTSIRDHRITFTDLSQFPGDSRQDAHRMHRVVAQYDASIDIDEEGSDADLQSLVDDKLKHYIDAIFVDTFSPQVYAVEETSVHYEETAKRLSIKMQFLYQAPHGGNVVEVSQSVSYREQRTIDYTPIHGGEELTAEVDPGWGVLERMWQRNVVVIGEDTPKVRLFENPREGPAGLFGTIAGQSSPFHGEGDHGLVADGWNLISNQSTATPRWIGDPNGAQRILHTVLTETVVERYTTRPTTGSRTGVPIQSGPTTPNGGGGGR